MNFIYGMLLPSLIGLKFFKNINRDRKFTKIDYVYYYCTLVLFSNLICVFISHILFGLNTNLEDNLINFPTFSIKYIVVNLLINLLLPLVYTIIIKNVSYTLKVSDRVEKKNK